LAFRILTTLLLVSFTLVGSSAFAQDAPPSGETQESSPTPLAPTFEAASQKLAGEIEAVLKSSDVTGGRVGIYVADVETGTELYARRAKAPLNPASNMKLITSAAALDRFGPQHTFTTRVLAEDVQDGVVKGSLYVRGEGEAFLLFEDFIDWAAELRQKGVTRVEGDIVVDDDAFDEAYLPPGFEQKDEDASYRSPIGAVSVNFNAVTAVISPAEKAGEQPDVRLVPPNDHVEVVNRASTRPGGRRRLMVASKATEDGTKLVIDGYTGTRASPQYVRKRIDNPPVFAGSVFKSALEMVGIEVAGTVETGDTPDSAETMVSHRSQPLSYVILAMNKWSNNFMAEQLLRVLGVQGDSASTWEAAKGSVEAFLVDKVGFEDGSFSIHNGSGLYSGNEVSARQFVDLLRYMAEHPNAPEFKASLTIAGVDGTLRNRLRGSGVKGRVRGKTGTLNEVSALSGYARTESGRLLAFSVLFDDTPRRGWLYRPVQDRIVEAIVESM
jgi:D-alanyl-D-alanine carboxypeptidase/D-alanyl-D-alanine-endopeptidase (penicillin-binding protein 4)